MHQRQRRGRPLVLKIKVVDTNLIRQQQTLVIDCTCGKRRHVEFLAVFQLERLGSVRGTTTDDIQLAFKCIRYKHIGATTNKHLTDNRFFCAHRRRHRHFTIDRHVTPAQEHLAFSLDRTLDFLDTGVTRCCFLRQENHADTIFAERRQFDTVLGHFLTIKLIWNLNQDAGTVTLQRVGTHGTSMIEVLQDQQTLLDDTMAFLPLEMGHKAYTTSIVLVGWVV